MGEIVRIYHTDIELPDVPQISEIENWGTDVAKNQYWRKKKLPYFFDNLEFDTNGNVRLNQQQSDYAKKELEKIKNGFWFFNNGVPTYITGRNYYYLQYWTLENKKSPEYRDTSRRYYLYLEHWYKNYWCLGIIRGKGRRSGATSECSSNCTLQATIYKNSKVGITSKTSNDARKVFIGRVQFGFRHLVFFLQPTMDSRKDSKSELVFAVPISSSKKGSKSKLIDEVEGKNSTIDYQPTALNSYDSERLSWFFGDEGGKFPSDVPFDQFVSIISETLVEGAEKVGFAEFPSTVNEVTKRGGAAFKSVWNDATWKKDDKRDEEEDEEMDEEDETTANRLVRYFTPAYDGLAGFIDQYGNSIIDAPTDEQKEFLIAKYGERKYKGSLRFGSKKFLEKKRSKLQGNKLEEEIRKYPFDEVEMFMSANSDCHFDQMNINAQRKYLEDTNYKPRQVTFYRDFNTGLSMWRDDPNGYCFIVAFPPTELQNKFEYINGQKSPSNTSEYVFGVDSYASGQGGRKYGSKAGGFIYRKFDLTDPENTGLFVAQFYGRPTSKSILHEQILLMAEYYGTKIWFEFTSDSYLDYFRDRGKKEYLGKFPVNSIDPNKKSPSERFYGFPITPYAMTKQIDSLIGYAGNDANGNTNCTKIYYDNLLEQMLVYDDTDRTSSDLVVAAMVTLVCGLNSVHKKEKINYPLIQIYK